MESLGRVALGISYMGSNYLGWQTQPNNNTLQDTVQKALSRFLNHKVDTICSGRTDTGVHALNQVIHLDTNQYRSPSAWIRGLNSLLPADININWYKAVDADFNARFHALKRSYVYLVRNSAIRSPFYHNRAAHIDKKLNIENMRMAAEILVGEHDFSAFRSSQCQAPNPVRTVYHIKIIEQGDLILFHFCANAFLHHMIRNIMGALIMVGQGKQNHNWLHYLLENKDRKLSAPTFSANGLYLVNVEYQPQYNIPSFNNEDLILKHLGIHA